MTEQEYFKDAQGRLVPAHLVKDEDKLKDQTIAKVMGFAVELSEQIGRFKSHTFADVYALIDLLKEQYGAAPGGQKGNIQLISYNGCEKIEIAVADNIAFGPELQVAKGLIDECIEEWSDGSRDEIRALVGHAFDTRKTGRINREALFSLRRLEIREPKWLRAMEAIGNSIRIVGSKSYVRVYRRPTAEAEWEMIPLNIAAA